MSTKTVSPQNAVATKNPTKAYVIEACDDSWSADLELVAVTLDKAKAKEILTKIITTQIRHAKKDDLEMTKKEYLVYMDEWINDMLNEKDGIYGCDEFPNGKVWVRVGKLV